MKSLLSPNVWVGVASLLALGGLVCIAAGHKTIGIVLLAPILFGGVVLLLFVIPFLVLKNTRNNR
jgi:hypothetical protein